MVRRGRIAVQAKGHLGENALRRIRHDIINCALRPGEQVSEAALAERYGVGKAPIRYALAQLNQHGLIRTMPRRGYLVSPITLKDVFELLDLRRIIEPAAAELAAGKVDGGKLREIDAIYATARAAPDTVSEDALLMANRQIHAAIAAASNNRWVEDITLRMLDDMERVLRFAWAERRRTGRQFEGHAALIEALESGDSGAARKVALDHVDEARRVILKGLFEFGGARADLLMTAGHGGKDRKS
jgi:DNA-binding GntR family transcriptional regulator